MIWKMLSMKLFGLDAFVRSHSLIKLFQFILWQMSVQDCETWVCIQFWAFVFCEKIISFNVIFKYLNMELNVALSHSLENSSDLFFFYPVLFLLLCFLSPFLIWYFKNQVLNLLYFKHILLLFPFIIIIIRLSSHLTGFLFHLSWYLKLNAQFTYIRLCLIKKEPKAIMFLLIQLIYSI